MTARRLAGVAAAALALLLHVAPAQAAAGAEVGMEDERLLLGEPAAATAAVAEWAALGVDVVRVHASWRVIAPGRTARRPPPGFDGAEPGDPGYMWTALDRAVALVRAAGMRVALTVTGPGPQWASRDPARRNPILDPNPRAFGRFARAVARRYGPAVDRYLIWNEPNQPGWLQPQSDCAHGRCTPVAPHLYRALVRAAVPAIHAADPGAEVLIGELAPIGERARSSRSALAPLPFLRALGCVDRRHRALRSGRCRGFRPAGADALGHHPHGKRIAPDQHNPDADEAQIGDLARLERAVDRLTAGHRLRVTAPGLRRLPLHLTEFGYQTSPPDLAAGVTLAEQAAYLQQAAYVAWKDPRVRSLSLYQWHDEPVHHRGPGVRAYSGWQSGLSFLTGAPKPALRVFPAPLVADLPPGRTRGRLWGQVRPGGAHVITVERRPLGAAAFEPVATVTTDPAGYWTLDGPLDPLASYRATWPAEGGPDATGILDLGADPGRRLRPAAPP